MSERRGPAGGDAPRKPENTPHAALNPRDQRIKNFAAELTQVRRALESETLRRMQAEEVLQLRTAQLKATALDLTHAEQRERQRLAGVLHDHLQQLLVGAQLKVALLAKPVSQQKLRETVRDAAGILSEAIAQTRTLAIELSPPVLFEGGLVPALEWLGQWMRQKHGLTIRVTAAPEGLEAGDEKTRLMLFAAVRELLFNVTKHAKVTAASVQVQRVGDQIQIVVEDRGAGFADLQGNTTGDTDVNLGLFNIRHRLDLIGGRFEIDRTPGRGSRFTLRAPVG